MGEEFQESELIFPDDISLTALDTACEYKTAMHKRRRTSAAAININTKSTSKPVKIPETAYSLPNPYTSYDDDYEGDDGFDQVGTGGRSAVVVVPPHLIIARRVAAKTACSFYEHHGKALKGRNLSLVRNSILRMTGFLEA